jgi:GTPase
MIDRATISVIAGNGGNGCVSFRRELYVPRGGPNGGNGGKGGSIIAVGDSNMRTLMDLRYKKTFKADGGTNGSSNNKKGRDGEDRFVRVPPGTSVFDDAGVLLGDIRDSGQTVLLARGGRGGLGNWNFRSATRQSPRFSLPPDPGEEKEIRLELKLIADVGLVGEPNAGKSTLLSKLSNARPKIADYPFTTLEPNLGYVKVDETFHFIMADIPGLIEGAHDGKGLGLEFLRHIERTRVLVYLLDQSKDEKPGDTLKKLEFELKSYDPGLAKKPSIIVLNKSDITKNSKGLRNSKKRPILSISAIKGENLKKLLYAIKEKLLHAE